MVPYIYIWALLALLATFFLFLPLYGGYSTTWGRFCPPYFIFSLSSFTQGYYIYFL